MPRDFFCCLRIRVYIMHSIMCSHVLTFVFVLPKELLEHVLSLSSRLPNENSTVRNSEERKIDQHVNNLILNETNKKGSEGQ